MGINFDALPNGKPDNVPTNGTYYANIEKAEMKPPKDPTKKPYINVTLALKDKEGKSVGKIWDKITESDHDLMRYKLQRFITALEIPLSGTFELKDLCKIIPGKNFVVDIMREEREGQRPQGVVDIFTNEIYYPMSQASEIFEIVGGSPFINAADALDAQPTLAPAGTEDY